MAACHSITYVGEDLIGDPLDVKMFLATQWKLDEPMSEGVSKEELVLAYVRPSLAEEGSPYKRADSLVSDSDTDSMKEGGGN